MGDCKEILKELEHYCMNEDGLESKKNANRKQYNFQRLMDEFKSKRNDGEIRAKYEANISKSKTLVDRFKIIHNTNLDSIISIIQNDALLSIDEMEKRDISFNFRISFRGINDEMHKYVFGATEQGDLIYGLYQINFKKEVESLSDTQFIPKSYIEYGPEVLQDYFMDIKNWRDYLAEEIAMTNEEPGKYIWSTPVHLRPEFIFSDKIPVSYFESIICANDKACTELIRRIKKEFGENVDILNIIKVAGE